MSMETERQVRRMGTASGEERVEIVRLLGSGMGLMSLPLSLERGYRAVHMQQATAIIRTTWPITLFAVLVIAALTLLQFGTIPMVTWITGGLVGFAFSLVIGAVYLSALNRWLYHCMGLGAFVCSVAMHVSASVHDIAILKVASQFGVAYITIAAFTIANMPVKIAGVWASASLFVALILSLTGWFPVDYALFLYYAVSSLIIGAVLGVVQELRQRRVFVQERLLAIENAELDALSRELDRISRHDALTGLVNRRHFDEILQEEWGRSMRAGEPLAVLFLDVDHFKRFNDHYGHQQGDYCLSQVGAALARNVQRSGDVVARYGGEEFVALFPRTSLEGAAIIAAKIIGGVDRLELPHAASPTADIVTVSVGVASVVPHPAEPPTVLLQMADEALYRAKEAGRHCYRLAGVGMQ